MLLTYFSIVLFHNILKTSLYVCCDFDIATMFLSLVSDFSTKHVIETYWILGHLKVFTREYFLSTGMLFSLFKLFLIIFAIFTLYLPILYADFFIYTNKQMNQVLVFAHGEL